MHVKIQSELRGQHIGVYKRDFLFKAILVLIKILIFSETTLFGFVHETIQI